MIRVFFFSPFVCLFVLVRGRILVIKREFCFTSNDAPKKIGGIVVFGIQVVMNPSNFLFLTQKLGLWGQIGKNSQPREINLWCDQIMACSGNREKHILRNQKWDKTDGGVRGLVSKSYCGSWGKVNPGFRREAEKYGKDCLLWVRLLLKSWALG